MLSFRSLGVLAAIAVLSAVPARSAFLEYNSRTDWQANVTGEQSVNYEGPTAPATISYNTYAGYTSGVFQVIGYYTEALNWLQGVAPGPGAQSWEWGLGAILRGYDSINGTKLVVNFSNAPTAVGLHLMTRNPEAGTVSISVKNGALLTTAATALRPTPTWWGVTGDTAINTLTLSVPVGATLMIDTMSAGVTAPPGSEIPEPSTMLLCGGGLLAAGLLRRKRR